MKGKKAIAIMWMMFFVVMVVFSATYVYFLNNKFAPEEKYIGSLQTSLYNLFHDANLFNFNVEKSAKISIEIGLKNLFASGGVLLDCENKNGYNILFSKDTCYLSKEIISSNFIEKFSEHFDNYLERLGRGITRYDYEYSINDSYLKGITDKKIEFTDGYISYSIKPNFLIKLEYDPLDFINMLKDIAMKEECLQKVEYNELTDNDNKIAIECGFSGDYEWNVKKKEGYLFFNVRSGKNLFFINKIDFRFAIPLNSLKLLRDSL